MRVVKSDISLTNHDKKTMRLGSTVLVSLGVGLMAAVLYVLLASSGKPRQSHQVGHAIMSNTSHTLQSAHTVDMRQCGSRGRSGPGGIVAPAIVFAASAGAAYAILTRTGAKAQAGGGAGSAAATIPDMPSGSIAPAATATITQKSIVDSATVEEMLALADMSGLAPF
jgi:hypothetical protein